MNRPLTLTLLAALTATALSASTSIAQSTLTLLPAPPGGTGSAAWDVSKGGGIVSGFAYPTTPGAGSQGAWWGEDGVCHLVPPIIIAQSVSADGQTIAGSGSSQGVGRAYSWTAAGGVQQLLPPAGFVEPQAYCTNGDGSLVGGRLKQANPTRYYAGLWTNGVPQAIAPPPGAGLALFVGIAAEAPVMAATVDFGGIGYPAVYSGGAFQVMSIQGPATDINADGTVVVGTMYPGDGRAHGFRWTGGTGQADIGTPPDRVNTAAYGVSEDGRIVVGLSNGGSNPLGSAVMWNADLGIVDLNTYLPTVGVDLGSTHLTSARAVSDDGCSVVIVGTAKPLGSSEVGFRVEFGAGNDQDGDGLCDGWETDGIPYNDAQGVQRRYILDVNGDGISDANPLRKDLFVEVDAMPDREPIETALARVIAAFDQSPVAPPPVPGGLPGISLHIVRDEMNVPYRDYPNRFVEFHQDKAVFFGTPAERLDAPNWPLKKLAKAKAYRYCIFANRIGTSSATGAAEGFGCNDFFLALGSFTNEEVYQAATFMHELGHTLGLHHGGADDINYKPNYYSIMNYAWQFPTSYNPSGPTGTYELTYSSVEAPPLLESALSETAGLPIVQPQPRVPFTVTAGTGLCPNPFASFTCGTYAPTNASGPVDWNLDGVISPTLVSVNLNTGLDPLFNNPTGQLLRGHDDWSNLVFNFRTSQHYVNGAPPTVMVDEMDWETYQLLANLPPGDTGICNSDFNGDGDYGTDADIEAFFACLGGDCCLTCYVLGADFNGDGDWGTDADIEAFFRVLGGGNC